MKVLIATGDGRLDGALARVARRHGREVLVAADGESALDLAFWTRPSLIVLGEHLPGQSGWLVCAKLRIAGFAGTLVLTGVSPRHKVRDLAEAAGAFRYVAAADCESELAGLVLGQGSEGTRSRRSPAKPSSPAAAHSPSRPAW